MSIGKIYTVAQKSNVIMNASVGGTFLAPELKYREEGTAAAIAMHLVDAVRMGRMAMEEMRQAHITFRRLKTNSKKITAAAQRLKDMASRLACYSEIEVAMRLELSRFGPLTVRDSLLSHGITFQMETLLRMAEQGDDPSSLTLVNLLPGDTVEMLERNEESKTVKYRFCRGDEIVDVTEREGSDLDRHLAFRFRFSR